MRLTNIYLCDNGLAFQNVPKFIFKIVHMCILIGGLYLIPVAAAPSSNISTGHLLPIAGAPEQNEAATNESGERLGVFEQSRTGESERSNRANKEIFRLELLRQIKAIDHMKCFPKVLCGLSVDSDKSFGINKSNFVRSYLELMRNIKPSQIGAGDRLKTEDEVEGELLWRFSPHNPDRKHHSSFERISSAAMSASVELADAESQEYISRGFDSRLVGDSSTSVENVNRMGLAATSVESTEKAGSTSNLPSKHMTKMDSSKIPGEKKKKNNSNKSLTAKLSSYFSSWLPEISFVKEEKESTETEPGEMKRMTRSMNDEDNARFNRNWPLPVNDFPYQISDLTGFFQPKRGGRRQGRTDEATSGDTEYDALARDDIHSESTEHDADIYRTAVNIGKRLKDPKQCDYIYNGCPLEYNKILDMISSIRTDIQFHDETVDAVSHELGLESTSSAPTTTTTTTTTTTKKPQRKKPRPSTKIMHVLPNGEKVEINFRLGGSEDSEESSSERGDFDKKEFIDEDETSSERDNKGEYERVVVDLGQRSTLSSEEAVSSERRVISNRKGAPVDSGFHKSKSNKRKSSHSNHKKNSMSGMRTELAERSGEIDYDTDTVAAPKPSAMASLITPGSYNKPKTGLKLGGLTLTTDNDDETPLEISPSYVIIKHQPLSVHTTSLLSPENLQSSGQHVKASDRLQTFQLVQNGHQIDADQLTEQLKAYIRQNGGLIPKLSLHPSGLITTDAAETLPNINSYSFRHQLVDTTPAPTVSQKIHQPMSNPLTTMSFMSKEPVSKLSSVQSSNNAFKSSLPQSAYMPYSSYLNNGPAMVGSVPGRLDSLIKPKSTPTSTTTSTTTTSTTTEKMILPGMAETLTLDTDEITDDTVDKLSSQNSIPGWITPSSTSSSENEEESDEEKTMLENLNKTYLNDGASGSKTRYKNPKKKKVPVKANSSRVRNSSSKRNKGTKKGNNSSASEESTERIVIKHAGPYSSSPTLYKSPLKGPGPHGGAYPYLTVPSMTPNVFPGYPFWRYPL